MNEVDWTNAKPGAIVHFKNGGKVKLAHLHRIGTVHNLIFQTEANTTSIAYAVNGMTSIPLLDVIRIDPPPEKKSIDGWVNVYPHTLGYTYETKEKADMGATEGRKACVPITVEYYEGEGLK